MHLGIKQLAFMSVLVGVPVAAYFFVFTPQNQGIQKAKKEIELKQAMLKKLREATAQTADLRKANEQIQQSISAMQQRLPSDKELDMVLRDVAQIASTCGLAMPQFRKQEKSLSAGLAQEQSLSVQLKGDFDGVYRFFQELERLQRITRVTDMKFTRTADKSGEDDGTVQVDLAISIYFQDDATGVQP